jgi:hypothetical protein
MNFVHIHDALQDVPLERYSPEARKSISEFIAAIDLIWAQAYKEGYREGKEAGA